MCQTVVGPVLPRSSREAVTLPCSLRMHHLQFELAMSDVWVDCHRIWSAVGEPSS